MQDETDRLKDLVGLLNTSLVKRNRQIEDLRAQIEAAGGVVESDVSDQEGQHRKSSNVRTQDGGCGESEEEGSADVDTTETTKTEASTDANPSGVTLASHAADRDIDCSGGRAHAGT